MSKNVCSTCTHYKPAHATNPRGDCTLYPARLDVPAAHYCGQWAAVTATSKTTTTLDIDWSQVPEGYDWVAQDKNGLRWGFRLKPKIFKESNCWAIPTYDDFAWLIDKTSANPNWRNTLAKRPSGK